MLIIWPGLENREVPQPRGSRGGCSRSVDPGPGLAAGPDKSRGLGEATAVSSPRRCSETWEAGRGKLAAGCFCTEQKISPH